MSNLKKENAQKNIPITLAPPFLAFSIKPLHSSKFDSLLFEQVIWQMPIFVLLLLFANLASDVMALNIFVFLAYNNRLKRYASAVFIC